MNARHVRMLHGAVGVGVWHTQQMNDVGDLGIFQAEPTQNGLGVEKVRWSWMAHGRLEHIDISRGRSSPEVASEHIWGRGRWL